MAAQCIHQQMGANGLDCTANNNNCCEHREMGAYYAQCAAPAGAEIKYSIAGNDKCIYCGFIHGAGIQDGAGNWLIEPAQRNGYECYSCGGV